MTRLGILEVEAGVRAQSEPKQIRHTGAKGETVWLKHNLKKRLNFIRQSE